MLKISKAQMEGFKRASAQGFEGRMVAYLKDVFPETYEALGEPGARELIRYGMDKAEGYDIVSEYHICLYVCLMIELGRDFDVDPALAWAHEIMTDKIIDKPSDRLEILYDRVAERKATLSEPSPLSQETTDAAERSPSPEA